MYRRIGLHRRIDYQQIGISDSNVRHNKLVHRQCGLPATGDRRITVSDSNVQHNKLVHRQSGVPATGESPYQIPTFNTQQLSTPAKRRTGDRRPASRRIRFQRSTQQIGTPAKRRLATDDQRVAVSDSNVQHNKLVHQQSGVPATGESPYQIPTFNTQQLSTPAKRCTGDRRPVTGESPYQIPTFNTTNWYTGEAAYRRPATGDRRVAVSDATTGDDRQQHDLYVPIELQN